MFLLLILLSSISSFAQISLPTISFGNVKIGETRIPLAVSDFIVEVSVTSKKTRAKLIPGTIEWIRTNDVLLTPRARIAIAIKDEAENLHIRYQNQSLILQSNKKYAYIEFYVSLFQPDDIEIFTAKEKIGKIRVYAKTKDDKNERTHLIDYSCAPFNIEVNGLDGEYISIGCNLSRIGEVGREKALMELYWTSANYRLLDRSEPPYIAVFLKNNPIKMTVINEQTGKAKEITIVAKIPERMHRLKTAIGFGPYYLKSSQTTTLSYESELGSSFMLYGKLDFNEETSLRFFDAVVWKDSLFNNFGLYYAYDLALILDKRLLFTALIGLQHITFKFDSAYSSFTEVMFPQGIEIVYKHPFGLKNYSAVLGGFVDTGNSNNYRNLWFRFGKKWFWELNYISWQNSELTEQNASMWGLSVGFPFLSFF